MVHGLCQTCDCSWRKRSSAGAASANVQGEFYFSFMTKTVLSGLFYENAKYRDIFLSFLLLLPHRHPNRLAS